MATGDYTDHGEPRDQRRPAKTPPHEPGGQAGGTPLLGPKRATTTIGHPSATRPANHLRRLTEHWPAESSSRAGCGGAGSAAAGPPVDSQPCRTACHKSNVVWVAWAVACNDAWLPPADLRRPALIMPAAWDPLSEFIGGRCHTDHQAASAVIDRLIGWRRLWSHLGTRCIGPIRGHASRAHRRNPHLQTDVRRLEHLAVPGESSRAGYRSGRKDDVATPLLRDGYDGLYCEPSSAAMMPTINRCYDLSSEVTTKMGNLRSRGSGRSSIPQDLAPP